MRLLKRKTDVPSENAAPEAAPTDLHPDVSADPVAVTPVEAPEGVRTCPACQSPLADDQDWCLSCGSAQSRLGGRMPGMRAASTVAGLTAVLVAGAGAASYAALQDEPARPPAATTQMAQAPSGAVPSTPTPSTPTPSPLDPPPTTPATSETPIPDDPPEEPDVTDVPATPAPADTGDADTGGTTGDTGGSGSDAGSGDDDETTTTDEQPADTGPKVIALDAGAGALYDPYTRDTAAGDPGKAFDGNITTSFPITVAEAPEGQEQQINTGLAVDLGKKRSIRQIELTLKTPGAGLEVYATDAVQLPPDVLDSRWAHLRDLKSAGSAVDGHQTITLDKAKYRHVLLWFTTPPKAGTTTVRVTELQILG